MTVAVAAVTIWDHAAHQLDAMDPDDVEREADILEVSAQLTPAISRRLSGGTIDVIGRSHLVEAVRAHNDRQPNAPIDLKVDIRLLDEGAAFRLVAQEMNEAPRISAWDRGRFYTAAIAQLMATSLLVEGRRDLRASVSGSATLRALATSASVDACRRFSDHSGS